MTEQERLRLAEEEREITILMDEPDKNLLLSNISDIRGVLSFHKPQTQLIAVIHNLLLIYNLSTMPHINIIEMTKDYVEKVKNMVDKLVK